MESRDLDAVTGAFRDNWGEKAYSPRMLTMICRILSPLSRQQALQVVDQLAETSVKAPLPAQVRQAAMSYLRSAQTESKQAAIDELPPCHACGRSGLIYALLREDPRIEHFFGCPHCRAYETRKLRHPPLWHDGLREKFICISMRTESYLAGLNLRLSAFRLPPKKARLTPEERVDLERRLAELKKLRDELNKQEGQRGVSATSSGHHPSDADDRGSGEEAPGSRGGGDAAHDAR